MSTVLLIAPRSTIRETIKVYLIGRRSLEFLDAETAERGLAFLGLIPIQLIIADISLPDMNGVEVVRRLRSDPRAHICNLPVILLIGRNTADLSRQGLEAGANGVLEQPIDSGALNELVGKLLPAEKGRSPRARRSTRKARSK